jgi:CDP-6-deoxy-D-xylo-4-hexulose-3-dehydrase
MGAVFEGRQAGTFGLAGSFSSFFSHHILQWKEADRH